MNNWALFTSLHKNNIISRKQSALIYPVISADCVLTETVRLYKCIILLRKEMAMDYIWLEKNIFISSFLKGVV